MPVCNLSPKRPLLKNLGGGTIHSSLFTHTGLPHNETTIAEVVKSVGYSTAHLGKWHLGVGENYRYLPTTQGFDYYLVRFGMCSCDCALSKTDLYRVYPTPLTCVLVTHVSTQMYHVHHLVQRKGVVLVSLFVHILLSVYTRCTDYLSSI